MDTPEFLVWAIEYCCSVRGSQNGSDPERTERQLRAARAVSAARREPRVFEGYCLDPPNGFFIEDALQVYGGLEAVEQACASCPANAAERDFKGAIAGCIGELAISPALRQSFSEALDQAAFANRYQRLFSPTQPKWYGLWITSPLGPEQTRLIREILTSCDAPSAECVAISELRAGMQVAIDANLPFHAALFPAGNVEGANWRLETHCPRCKATWRDDRSRQCGVCGYCGHPAPDKRRKARGMRPYYPLDRLLGKEQAAELLLRYRKSRAQQGLTSPAESPPRAELPNNPRAD